MSDELEKLYQSTYTAVVRFLYRKVWDAERAEDLAQEVFVRALAHRPDKPRAWVFAVAAQACAAACPARAPRHRAVPGRTSRVPGPRSSGMDR